MRNRFFPFFLATALGLAGCTGGSIPGSATSDDRPTQAELYGALDRAIQLEFYSVDPEGGPHHKATGPQFMGFSVLGSVSISGPEKSKLIESFKKGIEEKSDSIEAGCFYPHHGLLARVDDKEYRVIICYICLQVYAQRTGQKSERDLKMLTTRSPNTTFSKVCVDHKLPVKEGH